MNMLLILLVLSLLMAHDTWLHAWLSGGKIEARATTSHRFPDMGDPICSERIVCADLLSEGSASPPLVIEPGEDHTSFFWEHFQGPCVATMRLNAHLIELPRDRFEDYLRDEGWLDKFGGEISEMNAERYTKCAKAVPKGVNILDAGDLRADHPLEIVISEGKPRALLFGESVDLPMSELFHGDLCFVRTHFLRRLTTDEVEWESLWATLTYYR